MNLILLFPEDFIDDEHARLSGRRLEHVRSVHRAAPGDVLLAGIAGGRIGKGEVIRLDEQALELRVAVSEDPPPPLPLTLVLAVPRPKVLNRVIAGAASLGVKRIILINAWRVEKSYWKSPRLSEENLRAQCVLGLEQARDTVLPSIELRRFFRPFVENELAGLASDSLKLVAHPGSNAECPRKVSGPVTFVIGPEGGFIAEEIGSLQRAGFTPVSLGARILRVETAVAAVVGRLMD
jgi:RsmE family RNA methyltransferase